MLGIFLIWYLCSGFILSIVIIINEQLYKEDCLEEALILMFFATFFWIPIYIFIIIIKICELIDTKILKMG